MTEIVLVGGSFGGMSLAYQLRRHLGKKHRITLISDREQFVFVPSLPWVAMGWRHPSRISFPIASSLRSKGIEFIHGAVERFDPQDQKVYTSRGEAIPYDYLGIATGADFDFGVIPGLGPEGGYTQAVDNAPRALAAYKAYQKLLINPGPVVIGATQGVSCFGPAYELAMMLDYDLRRRGLRHRVPMTFITSEPFIGHFGIGGLGASRRAMEDEFADRDIQAITNTTVEGVEQNKVELGGGLSLPFRFAMVMPPLKGVAAVRNCPGLANEKGFIPVDEFRRHGKYGNIYTVGVAVVLPPVEKTPVPTAPPKTGYMTEQMAAVAASNMASDIRGEKPSRSYRPEVVCLMDAGNKGFYMAADPLLPPRNKKTLKKGRWPHLLKIALEKMHLQKARRGLTFLP